MQVNREPQSAAATMSAQAGLSNRDRRSLCPSAAGPRAARAPVVQQVETSVPRADPSAEAAAAQGPPSSRPVRAVSVSRTRAATLARPAFVAVTSPVVVVVTSVYRRAKSR